MDSRIPNNPDGSFDGLFGDFAERRNALRGQFPSARVCDDRRDLAGWFKSAGFAIAATRKGSPVTE